ncbi:MAG: bifunctional phosphoribosylaminoimidazolecarboxamide formyltransferase/IMP cyclohydrolase [Bacteroidota bacterium]
MKTPAPTGTLLTVRRALISVSDKEGIVGLAQRLHMLGVELISTGGTSKALRDAGIPVTPISDVTGFPEILDGRVKTLHPNIHAGLLAVSDNPDHVDQLAKHGIRPIDLVIVNLYPFESTVRKPGVSLSEAIENVDIGGTAMVRASAKNYKHTAVVVNPAQYENILNELETHEGALSEETRFSLAREAFSHTAHYDAAITRYLGSQRGFTALPGMLIIVEPQAISLRYGENPHQEGVFYGEPTSSFEKLHGKDLSYNNILDLQAAVSLCAEFDEPSVIIVKHNNPCGVATGNDLTDAYHKALATDPKSAFGGIVAVNRTVDRRLAEVMNELFLEIIAAPGFESDALEVLKKKKDRRLLRMAGNMPEAGLDIRSAFGGFLVQTPDRKKVSLSDVKTVTTKKPTNDELVSLLFAWRVAKHVRSNAIVYARADRTLGIGAGQMSRIDSSKIAALKATDAGLDLKGCAVASDAFFPFADGLVEAIRIGATSVIQPGGSVRDQEVIDAANAHGIAMVFTGIRHFRH